MKVYSIKQEVMDIYVEPIRGEGFQPEHLVHLGDADGRTYHSYDPAHVTLSENDEKYDQKVYDSKNAEDKAHLTSVINKLHFLRQVLLSKKAVLFETVDMFDVIAGIVEQDKYILDTVAAVKADVDQILENYGF
jgi:hypothetical protein